MNMPQCAITVVIRLSGQVVVTFVRLAAQQPAVAKPQAPKQKYYKYNLTINGPAKQRAHLLNSS